MDIILEHMITQKICYVVIFTNFVLNIDLNKMANFGYIIPKLKDKR